MPIVNKLSVEGAPRLMPESIVGDRDSQGIVSDTTDEMEDSLGKAESEMEANG